MPRDLASQLVPLVEQAQPAGTDALIEVESLIALTAGLAVSVLIGSYTAKEAVAFVDYRLDRLFTG
nr:TetR family transcriptional regulator C-terminal domain-containing protein [Amycolatopsis aidingensis]